MTKDNFSQYVRSLLFYVVSTATCISTNSQGASHWGEIPESETKHKNSVNTQDVNNLGIRLYAQNENLLLRFENGNSVIFKPSNNLFSHRILKNKVHSNEKLGRIETENANRIWYSNQNVKVEFLGSYPVAVSKGDQRVSLTYKHHKQVQANALNQIYPHAPNNLPRFFEHFRKLLVRVEQLACATDNKDEQCNNPDAPLPVGFGEPQSANELHIHTRPSDCYSYFTAYPSIERGTAIEAALGQHPPYLGSASGSHSFPVADYWNNGNVYVLISRDLTSSTYDVDNPDGFYEQLIDDGENIHENLIQPLATEGQISQTSLGETTTLYKEDAQVIYLDVVVQYGIMSDSQKSQFDRAAEELLSLHGIILRLVMIP